MPFEYDLHPFIPFRDAEACARVRAIKKEEITRHSNPDFKITVIESLTDFYTSFAMDIVEGIQRTREEGRRFVAILPVGPVPQFTIAAKMINTMRIPLDHLHTFNMDEYADQDGNTAPAEWPGSFQKAMLDNFFLKIDEELRPPLDQAHFPTTQNISAYGKMIEDLGGADVCFGGIGWCGHIAFWEAHLGEEFGDDIDAYCQAGSRIVELHPMTIMQNALHSFGGDWSQVPPKAATIGPAEVMKARYRSFWLSYSDNGVSWQRFIARLCAHGPVSTLVPGSILQTAPGTYNIWGDVAENVEIDMS